MINIDKEGEALSQALSAMLKKAKAAGVKKPGIYFESEGSVYVVNTEHPGWDYDSGTERKKAIVAQVYIKVPFDVGAW